ncbi:MAG: ankyrin repeat domain-containing protein [Nitrosomonas sp. PRO4]|nr:ankyrin repeat domain-containing protein [Nitrosomonas sp. PRO4]
MTYLLKTYSLFVSTVIFLCLSLTVSAGIQDDFIWAVEKGNLTDVTKLLKKGANPDTPSREGYTPLMIAAQTMNLKLAELLIDAGADLRARNKYGETAIMLASYHGQKDMVRLFYMKGAEINHSGWNPLLYAASSGHSDTIQLLVSVDADVNSISDNGTTPLMMAVRGNHLDAVNLLLAKGADPTIKNEHGDNALSWAEKKEHLKILKLLKKHVLSK